MKITERLYHIRSFDCTCTYLCSPHECQRTRSETRLVAQRRACARRSRHWALGGQLDPTSFQNGAKEKAKVSAQPLKMLKGESELPPSISGDLDFDQFAVLAGGCFYHGQVMARFRCRLLRRPVLELPCPTTRPRTVA